MTNDCLVVLMLEEGLQPAYRGFLYLKTLMEFCPLEGEIPPLKELYTQTGIALGTRPSAVMQGIRLCLQNADSPAPTNQAMIYRLRARLWAEGGQQKIHRKMEDG